MALISFLGLAGDGVTVNDLSGSGLGFYGPGGYSTSVNVGSFQDNTYITDATGTATNSIKVCNVKWTDNASGMIPTNDNRLLSGIPNYLSSLQISFTNSTAVRTQNAQLRIFDRSDIDNPPVGVVCKVAPLVHPWNTESPPGSGATTWYTPGGSGSILNLSDLPCCVSPGSGGLCPSGSNTTDTEHDWFFCISAMPSSISSKFFALYFSLEFL